MSASVSLLVYFTIIKAVLRTRSGFGTDPYPTSAKRPDPDLLYFYIEIFSVIFLTVYSVGGKVLGEI